MSLEKYPHYLSSGSIDSIGANIAELIYSGKPELLGINEEIGIAKTREILSNVQRQMSSIFGIDGEYTVLMLTEAEVHALLELNLPNDIKDTLRHGL